MVSLQVWPALCVENVCDNANHEVCIRLILLQLIRDLRFLFRSEHQLVLRKAAAEIGAIRNY